MILEPRKIGEILIDLRVLTPEEVERVLSAMRRRRDNVKFGQLAREMKYLKEEHILAALAVQMELFPRVAHMSLQSILQKLSSPVKTNPQLPVAAVRRRLASR